MNKEKLIKWLKDEARGCKARGEKERERAMNELLLKIERGYFDEKDEPARQDEQVGSKITLMDGKQRILKKDKRGIYVLKGGLRSYVEYHHHTGRYAITGKWGHK